MKIEKNRVVRLHYALLADDGSAVESTRDGDPVTILVGFRNVVYGLEEALHGHEAGDTFEVEVAPEDGYGPRREGWTERFSKKHFSRPKSLKVGEPTVVRSPHGARSVTVVKIGGKVVDVDMNHPLAGKRLRYAVEVIGIREADPGEIAHGHVHGDAGNH